DEFKSLIAQDSASLEMVVRRMKYGSEYGNDVEDYEFENALSLLNYGLQNTSLLEMLIGHGLMEPLARYLCSSNIHQNDIEANMFRRVLLLHPEWKQKFRSWTHDGTAHSHTANLGRTIPLRVRSRPVRYTVPYEDGTL
ncbi:hypothetical protein PENTCL1PPCAC_655, partial [Pristionchus entomophagus]